MHEKSEVLPKFHDIIQQDKKSIAKGFSHGALYPQYDPPFKSQTLQDSDRVQRRSRNRQWRGNAGKRTEPPDDACGQTGCQTSPAGAWSRPVEAVSVRGDRLPNGHPATQVPSHGLGRSSWPKGSGCAPDDPWSPVPVFFAPACIGGRTVAEYEASCQALPNNILT